MIFVGEHTSYTHAWIASALESGIRGSVQLLLELGLVDEAKATAEKWMARWIEVVRGRVQIAMSLFLLTVTVNHLPRWEDRK